MRVVFDAAEGRTPDEAEANLRPVQEAAATLALLMGEAVSIGLSERGGNLSRERRSAILASYDVAIRVQRGDLSIRVSKGATKDAKVMAKAISRHMWANGHYCPVRAEKGSMLLAGVPGLVIFQSQGIDREGRLLAAAVASSLAAEMHKWALVS